MLGGGGGASDYAYPASGGYAGGLTGGSGANGKYPDKGSVIEPPTGGTQTTGGSVGGGTAGTIGSFGRGGNGHTSWGSAGGGGYYGGSGGGYVSNSVNSGAGGSSFISGHNGCIAIDYNASTSTTNIVHLTTGDKSILSYNGKQYKFNNTEMIDGKTAMISPTGTTEVGHTGDGYVRITKLEK